MCNQNLLLIFIQVVMSGRYEFYGTGKDLLKAILIALNIVPEGFAEAPARC